MTDHAVELSQISLNKMWYCAYIHRVKITGFKKKCMHSLPDVLHVEGVLKAHVFHIIVVGDFVRVLSLQMSENKSSLEVLIFFSRMH